MHAVAFRSKASIKRRAEQKKRRGVKGNKGCATRRTRKRFSSPPVSFEICNLIGIACSASWPAEPDGAVRPTRARLTRIALLELRARSSFLLAALYEEANSCLLTPELDDSGRRSAGACPRRRRMVGSPSSPTRSNRRRDLAGTERGRTDSGNEPSTRNCKHERQSCDEAAISSNVGVRTIAHRWHEPR